MTIRKDFEEQKKLIFLVLQEKLELISFCREFHSYCVKHSLIEDDMVLAAYKIPKIMAATEELFEFLDSIDKRIPNTALN